MLTQVKILINILIILIILIGVQGIYGIFFGKKNLKDINKEYEALNILSQVDYNFNNSDDMILSLIDEGKASSRGYYKIRFINLSEEINKKISEYREVIESNNTNLDNFNKTFNEYNNSSKSLIKLIDSNNYKEANSLYKNTLEVLKNQLVDGNNNRIKEHRQRLDTLYVDYNNQSKNIVVLNIICIVVSILFAYILLKRFKNRLTTQLKNLRKYTSALGNGDLSFKLEKYFDDEIGNVIEELDIAINNVKNLIVDTKTMVEVGKNNSESNSMASNNIINEVIKAKDNIYNITDKVDNLNSNCEEATLSTQEIIETTNIISKEILHNSNLATEMNKKAKKIEEKGLISAQTAFDIFNSKSEEITIALEKGKVIQDIDKMLEIIKNISKEVNLLSINASIEAARAGSNGNGFYVIAEEIRRLSEETDENLKEMKQTVSDVTNAFQEISCNSKELLEFLNTKVRKDYNILIDISSSYGTDMETLSEGAIKIDNITKSIFIYMNEICKSIEGITYSTNNILDNSKETNTEIKSIEEIVNGLGKSIEEENLLLSKLQISLKQFVI